MTHRQHNRVLHGAVLFVLLAFAAVDASAGQLDPSDSTPIGVATDTIEWRDPLACPVTHLITDAMREFGMSDVALYNFYGAGASIPRGVIYEESLRSVLPYENRIAVIRMKGSELIRHIEDPRAEGIRNDWTLSGVRRDGSTWRLSSGRLLEPGRFYRVAISDHFLGPEQPVFVSYPRVFGPSLSIRRILAEYIRRHSPISPDRIGRRESAVLPADPADEAEFSLFVPPTPTITHSMDSSRGEWVNSDPRTGGITRLVISDRDTGVMIAAWGKCHPQDCAWGEVEMVRFGDNVSSTDLNYSTAEWMSGFSNTFATFRREGDSLVVETFTRFLDHSNRTNYRSSYRFRRAGSR